MPKRVDNCNPRSQGDSCKLCALLLTDPLQAEVASRGEKGA